MNKSKNEDLRIIRTKYNLKESLQKLLQDNKLEEITVLNICDYAMIHRATFYKHYEDKYHLLQDIYQIFQMKFLV